MKKLDVLVADRLIIQKDVDTFDQSLKNPVSWQNELTVNSVPTGPEAGVTVRFVNLASPLSLTLQAVSNSHK